MSKFDFWAVTEGAVSLQMGFLALAQVVSRQALVWRREAAQEVPRHLRRLALAAL